MNLKQPVTNDVNHFRNAKEMLDNTVLGAFKIVVSYECLREIKEKLGFLAMIMEGFD